MLRQEPGVFTRNRAGSVPLAALLAAACGSNDRPREVGEPAVAFREDVRAVESAGDAREGVFIPPFLACRPPPEGETGRGPGGDVCTNVSVSGATEAGKYFPDHASCEVVRTQSPFRAAPPARESLAGDLRLLDPAFMVELVWAAAEVGSTGCACCHDSRAVGSQAAGWDIRAEPIWIDTLSDPGLALFTGLADSSFLGAYPAAGNNGFDRVATGIPTSDTARMRAFTLAELARRGISEEEAARVAVFAGHTDRRPMAPPLPCAAGEGVDPNGFVHWRGGPARYVYVLAGDAESPGLPPNLDTPVGTLFRLDVLASAAALASGFPYGTTPAGSFQSIPESTRAPGLERGTRYRLSVLRDVGAPLSDCTFEYGEGLGAASRASDAGEGAKDAGPTPAGDGSACGQSDRDANCP